MLRDVNPEWDDAAAVPLAIELIQHYEGFRKKAYLDPVGIWTVGWGRTGRDVNAKTTTTAQQELVWLENRVRSDIDWLVTLLPDLTPHQAAALASFVYNVGRGAFTKSTLLRMIRATPRRMADVEFQWKRWVFATKQGKRVRLRGLETRRASEYKLFHTGDLELPN
jgi:GH24 family phage-related lysozyme (muramidase)